MNDHALADGTKDLAFSDRELKPIQTPKIGTTIDEIHSTLRSAFELSNNLRGAVYIVSGKQIDTNCDFAELRHDNIPDDLLALQRNVVILTDSLQKTLETLENSL
jgi:hypothetical protein